jgi:hypothetical protein
MKIQHLLVRSAVANAVATATVVYTVMSKNANYYHKGPSLPLVTSTKSTGASSKFHATSVKPA